MKLWNESYSDYAKRLFREGYNCSQSVFCTFAEECGIPWEAALRISSPFGGGIGRMRETCGAVSAMMMVAGWKMNYTDPSDDRRKQELYTIEQEMAHEFQKRTGSILCRDLLGLKAGENNSPVPTTRTADFYADRPCEKIIGIAAEIVAEHFFRN